MRLILKPQSRDGLDDIVIDNGLFAVGRAEEPFASYAPAVTEHLSRRHARIFIENGGAYIADLGSRNGTRLNDKQVEFRPMRLFPGDTLCFANQLAYRVDILDQEQHAANEAPAPVLELLPRAGEPALEPIVVTGFPFLVGKHEQAFQTGGGEAARQLDFLSRRHAHIFSRGGQLYLEDLGSTNGTTLNGERLDEHARPLASGDLLGFGGDHFQYTVRLRERAAGESGDDSAGAGPAAEGNTRFISAADSFLDIFCVELDDRAEAGAASAEPAAPSGAVADHRRAGPIRRARLLLGEFREALAGAPTHTRRGRFALPFLLALALAGGIAYHYLQPEEAEIRQLLDSGQAGLAARRANEALARAPDSESLSILASRALLRHLVPDWQQRLSQQDYAGARQLVHGAAPLASHSPRNDSLLDLLEWITQLQQFVDRRGGLGAPVGLYDDGDRLEQLLEWWDRDRVAHRSAMGMIAEQVATFEPMNREVFSQLRSLRNDRSVYLAAGDKLKQRVEAALASGDAASLRDELADFERQYPRLGGIDTLRADLEQYLAVEAAVNDGELVRAAGLVERSAFSTPPFQRQVEALQSRTLPSADILAAYATAASDWRDGELERALDQLEWLRNQPGGDFAARQLQAKRQLISDYATLQTYRGGSEYGDRLVRFYSRLDPDRDRHFVAALSRDFRAHRGAARQRADEAWQNADRAWRDYRERGGIRGLLRLEESVSDEFEQKSVLLRDAFSSAATGRQVYRLLSVRETAGQTSLYADIVAELNLQRRSLEQLSMVLPPALLDAKLALLPVSNGAQQTAAPERNP
ncbi:FHA domain-containing protein [Parahaliea mediterranea]|uniref:FHA domain-containing protein n=1 Tax=Parahaliea mediterranea TaxID=651086 RepID=A0A939DBH8_9GAMM|nr:FHA domain-containing protein [Parahaliea mediterranea]MBN7795010.1 FHA domain-containing protein [Parahaliea mediterranea]